jgi:hypothetical protein
MIITLTRALLILLCPFGAGTKVNRTLSTGSAALHPWLQPLTPPGPTLCRCLPDGVGDEHRQAGHPRRDEQNAG